MKKYRLFTIIFHPQYSHNKLTCSVLSVIVHELNRNNTSDIASEQIDIHDSTVSSKNPAVSAKITEK
jgi:hypothetical protein